MQPKSQPKLRPRVFSGPVEQTVEVTTPLDDATLPSNDFHDEMPILGEVAAPAVEYEVYTNITLRLPQAIYAEYSKIAEGQELSVEDVMQHRLIKCRNHNALRGLWFSDSERSQLEELIKKRPIETSTQALALLSSGGIFSVEDIKISLTIPQRKVLDLRNRHGMPAQKIFEDMIRREFRV